MGIYISENKLVFEFFIYQLDNFMSKFHHTIYTHWIGLEDMLNYYGALGKKKL